MKIVMIHGQNHHGSTWSIGHCLVDHIKTEKEVQEFYLPRDLPHFCLGCYRCLNNLEACPYWHEKEPMINAMLKADVLILTSPTYCMMPSAPMKSFLDLFYTNWMIHKPYPQMFMKKAVVISTAAGMGAKSTTRLLAKALHYWGISEVIQYGKAVHAMNYDQIDVQSKKKIEEDMQRIVKRLSYQKVHVSVKVRCLFYFCRWMQKMNWGASIQEKQYWENQGWLDKKKPWRI